VNNFSDVTSGRQRSPHGRWNHAAGWYGYRRILRWQGPMEFCFLSYPENRSHQNQCVYGPLMGNGGGGIMFFRFLSYSSWKNGKIEPNKDYQTKITGWWFLM